MSKMRYFSNKFSKSPSAGGSPPPPAPLNLRFLWPKVAWFCKIVAFQTYCSSSSS